MGVIGEGEIGGGECGGEAGVDGRMAADWAVFRYLVCHNRKLHRGGMFVK